MPGRAFENLVTRLMNSVRYGEHMAWNWLEASRYSDTNGYQGDRTRTMHYWRDWVVRSSTTTNRMTHLWWINTGRRLAGKPQRPTHMRIQS